MNDTPDLLTIGDLARETGQKKHQISYAIAEYHIEPVQRAGIIRLFHRDQLPLIKSSLRRISGKQGVVSA